MRSSDIVPPPCGALARPAASAVAASGAAAERGEVVGAAEARLRRRRCVQQLRRRTPNSAAGSSHAGEQALRLLLQRKARGRPFRSRPPGWRACDRPARSASRRTSARRPCGRRIRAAVPAAAPRHAAACRRGARSAARPSLWDRWCGRSARPATRALKIAAAAGLPQRIRVASALHSHAGTSPVAYGARRGSLRKPRRDPCSLIHALAPASRLIGLSNLIETVIVPGTGNVHAGQGLRARTE